MACLPVAPSRNMPTAGNPAVKRCLLSVFDPWGRKKNSKNVHFPFPKPDPVWFSDKLLGSRQVALRTARLAQPVATEMIVEVLRFDRRFRLAAGLTL